MCYRLFTSYCQIKKKTPLKRMFQALKTIEPDLNPKTIMVDFEKGAMNALILALKKEQNTNKIKIEQYIAGECSPAKKKYQDKAQRLKQICYDFENRFIDDYLQVTTHNIQLQL